MSTYSLADYVCGLNIATNKEWLTHQESLALRIAHIEHIMKLQTEVIDDLRTNINTIRRSGWNDGKAFAVTVLQDSVANLDGMGGVFTRHAAVLSARCMSAVAGSLDKMKYETHGELP